MKYITFLIMLFSFNAYAIDLTPGQTEVINCLLDTSCPEENPDLFKLHGPSHPEIVQGGVDFCTACHGPDLLMHQTVTRERNCAAPAAFYPLGIDSRLVDTGVGGEIEAIGSKFAPMRDGDLVACYTCHGAKFNSDMPDGHNDTSLQCVACHGGGTEPPQQCDKDEEPEGKSPGDKHCNDDLNCLSCHNQCDERLDKCEDEEDDD